MMTMKSMSTPFALALALAMSGCFWVTTKHEGEKLRTDVDRLQTRVDTELGAKVTKLEKVLDQATKLLTRNSADLGAEVNGLVQENAKLNGLVMEVKRTNEELRKQMEADRKAYTERIEALETKLAGGGTGPKRSANDLFDAGKTAFDAGKYSQAQQEFKNFVLSYPEHAKAGDAQYYRAESAFKDKDYRTALGEFQRVFEKYPKSDLADDALFRAGESAEALKWCTDARAYYGLLRQRYARSSLAKKAKQKDADLKKAASDKKKCSQ